MVNEDNAPLTADEKRRLGENLVDALDAACSDPTCECHRRELDRVERLSAKLRATADRMRPVVGGQGRSSADVEQSGAVVGLVLMLAMAMTVGFFLGRLL